MKRILEITGILVGIIAGGITIYLFATRSGENETPPPPPPVPPGAALTLESIAGTYDLVSWTENTQSGEALGINAKSGQLTVSPTGEIAWELALQAKDETGNPISGITCKGEYDLSESKIRGIAGGTSVKWSRSIESVKDYVWMSFCGYHLGQTSLPFALTMQDNMLQMENVRGVFKWQKK